MLTSCLCEDASCYFVFISVPEGLYQKCLCAARRKTRSAFVMPFGFVGYLNINEGCNTCNLVLIPLVSIFELCNQHGRTLRDRIL